MNILDNETFGYGMCFVFFLFTIYMIMTLIKNNYTLLDDMEGNIIEGFTPSESDEKAEKIGLCMLEKLNRELHPSINRIGLSRDARYDFRIDYSSTESYFHVNDVNPIQYGNPLELTESTNETIWRIAKECGANIKNIKWNYVSKRVLGHPEDYIEIIRR